MSIQGKTIVQIGTTKEGLPILEAKCIKCGHRFGIVRTPRMDGRTIPCPECKLRHIIRFEDNISLELRAIVPYIYEE